MCVGGWGGDGEVGEMCVCGMGGGSRDMDVCEQGRGEYESLWAIIYMHLCFHGNQ